MKYWGRSLIVYLTITAVLYGTREVQMLARYSSGEGPRRGGRAPFTRLPGRTQDEWLDSSERETMIGFTN